MGLLRKLGWAVALVALGAVLATAQVEGKTPLQHLGAALAGPVWHGLQAGVAAAYERAKVLLASQPVEHHSPEDRDALNKLIAKRAAP
ncbi:MAG: hypothetical protein ACLQDQ_08255 [Myxococcaceae bacterium]